MHPLTSPLDVKQVQHVDQIVGLLHLQTDLFQVIHTRRKTREDVEHRPRAVCLLAEVVAVQASAYLCLGGGSLALAGKEAKV